MLGDAYMTEEISFNAQTSKTSLTRNGEFTWLGTASTKN